MLALDLLGPVTLRREGRVLPLPVRKTAALLVLLALRGPLARAQIAALLWPALDEPQGRRNLRRELFRLSESGAGSAVTAEADRLSLAPGLAVDLPAWEQLGDAEAALALWRGPLADGLQVDDAAAFMEWLDGERERVHRRWRRHVEAAAEASARAGRTDDALALLDRLLADDPLQERHHRLAMQWLAAAGRREDALARYRRCRDLLRAELGLAPATDTEALVASIVGGAGVERRPGVPPAAVLPPEASRPLLPERLPFVGRDDAVAWLERAWRSGGVVLIEGEGGIGKSRLAVDFAAAHGPVALARCQPSDTEVPLASLARALQVLGGPVPEVGALPGWVVAELARLLPGLGPAPLALRSEAEHARFGEALAIAWRHWADGNFDAVVLDDWHLADGPSQALLPAVTAARDGATPPRVLVVYRPDLSVEAALRLQRLKEAGAPHRLLAPLDEPAVLDLLQRLSGAARPERFASRLTRATGGHPFHIVETLEHLGELGLLTADADGVWHTPFDAQTEDYRELPVPASVREAVLGRVQRLAEPVRRMLDAAALAGEPFDARLLAPACALSEVEGDLALERALDARLLQEHRAGGYVFVHDLVPQALVSALDAPRQRLVHRRLALGAEAAGGDAARIARHFEAGAEPRRALPWRCRAAEDALRLHALEEAVQHWRQARADGGDGLAGDEALAIAQGLLRVLVMQGRIGLARDEATDLLARAARGEGSATVRVDAIIAAAGLLSNVDEDARVLELLDRLREPMTPRQRAAALRVRASALRGLGRIAESEAAVQQALGAPDLAPEDRTSLLDTLTMSAMAAGRVREALAHAEAALEASRTAGDTWGAVRSEVRRASLLGAIGEPSEAEAALEAAAATAGRMGMVGQQRVTLFNLCVLHSSRSRPDRVLAAARQSWELQPPLPREGLRTQLQLAFVEAHVALGELGEAWTWLQGAVEDALAIGQIAGLAGTLNTGFELATLLGESGRMEPLRIALAGADEARHFLVELRIVRTECALLEGDPGRARALLDEATEPSEEERVLARLAIARAAVLLAAGNAPAALAALPADDAAGLNDELRWRALAVRIDAERSIGALPQATLAAARAALARSQVHAVAQWLLHRALARAEPGEAAAVAARTAALAATLAGHPVQRSAFVRRWG